ncbi:hypothetical protein FOA52_010551 [Chlamydomonas sp. UWO 241]|nr:hypothetical protein FOA52_010551 [Chlamydomonas sp. UWO 241]
MMTSRFYAGACLACIAVLALVACCTAQVPQECIAPGLELRTACAASVAAAGAAFGVEAGTRKEVIVTQEAIDDYLNNPVHTIDSGCCTAAKAFNAARCNCDANTLELVTEYTGGSMGVYELLAGNAAVRCGYELVMGAKCSSTR